MPEFQVTRKDGTVVRAGDKIRLRSYEGQNGDIGTYVLDSVQEDGRLAVRTTESGFTYRNEPAVQFGLTVRPLEATPLRRADGSVVYIGDIIGAGTGSTYRLDEVLASGKLATTFVRPDGTVTSTKFSQYGPSTYGLTLEPAVKTAVLSDGEVVTIGDTVRGTVTGRTAVISDINDEGRIQVNREDGAGFTSYQDPKYFTLVIRKTVTQETATEGNTMSKAAFYTGRGTYGAAGAQVKPGDRIRNARNGKERVFRRVADDGKVYVDSDTRGNGESFLNRPGNWDIEVRDVPATTEQAVSPASVPPKFGLNAFFTEVNRTNGGGLRAGYQVTRDDGSISGGQMTLYGPRVNGRPNNRTLTRFGDDGTVYVAKQDGSGGEEPLADPASFGIEVRGVVPVAFFNENNRRNGGSYEAGRQITGDGGVGLPMALYAPGSRYDAEVSFTRLGSDGTVYVKPFGVAGDERALDDPASYGVEVRGVPYVPTPVILDTPPAVRKGLFRPDGTEVKRGEIINTERGAPVTFGSLLDGDSFPVRDISNNGGYFLSSFPRYTIRDVTDSDEALDALRAKLSGSGSLKAFRADGSEVKVGDTVPGPAGGTYTLLGVTDAALVQLRSAIGSFTDDPGDYGLTVRAGAVQDVSVAEFASVVQAAAPFATPQPVAEVVPPSIDDGRTSFTSLEVIARLEYLSKRVGSQYVPELRLEDGTILRNVSVTIDETDFYDELDGLESVDRQGRSVYGTATWTAGVTLTNVESIDGSYAESRARAEYRNLDFDEPPFCYIRWSDVAENLVSQLSVVQVGLGDYAALPPE